jgi:hypothetical protein
MRTWLVGLLAIGVGCGPLIDPDHSSDTNPGESGGTGIDTDGADGTSSHGDTTTGDDSAGGGGPTSVPMSTSAGTDTAGLGPRTTAYDGTYHLVVSTKIAPDLPLQFVMTIGPAIEGWDEWTGLTLTPLSLDPGSTTAPREPLGVVNEKMFILEDPVLDLAVDPLDLPGTANPITGSDVEATVRLEGSFQDENFACGVVSGAVQTPLSADLAGSTFAATRVESVYGPFATEFPGGCPPD